MRPAHPALVSEAEFVAAQHVRAARQSRDGRARSYPQPSRKQQLPPAGAVDGPRYVYVREDLLVSELVGRLADRPAVPDTNQFGEGM